MNILDCYPLPIPVEARTNPEDWLPVVEDETGLAQAVWDVMCNLKLGAGMHAGKLFGTVAQEWQRRAVWAICGPARNSSTRKFWIDLAFLTCAKKNGKTQFFALFFLALMILQPTRDGRYFLLAGNKKQADLIFDPVAAAIEGNRELSKIFTVSRYKTEIVHRETNSKLRTLALELTATVGEIPTLFYVDELHLVTRNPKSAALIDQMLSGLVASGGLGIFTTTFPLPGEPRSGIFQSTVTRANSIIDGTSERAFETMLPIMFVPLPDQDLSDSSLWFRSNPSLDITVPLEWLLQKYDEKKALDSQLELNNFYSQHLNADLSNASGVSTGWPVAGDWHKWDDPSLPVDLEEFAELVDNVWIGIDAGGRDDLAALLAIGRLKGPPHVTQDAPHKYIIWTRAWVRRDSFARNAKNVPLYEEAEARKEMVCTTGPYEDLDGIISVCTSLKRLAAIGIDPEGLPDLVQRLASAGLPVFTVPQGRKIFPYTESIERACDDGALWHPPAVLLPFCLSSLRFVQTSGQAKIIDKPAENQKIDMAIALFCAWAALISPEYKDGKIESTYERDDFAM